MTNNEFQTIGLYDHNADSYRMVKSAYESGEDIVGIVHATGTGKSYNALQLAYDNKDKKIVYVVPSNGIIEHIKKIIEDNPNLDLKRDFPNLEFRTYQSFISLDREEIADINCDLLILDEFHHIGAPVWGQRIDTMIDTHPEMKVFGMTAYTVRDRGTSYERDMANPDTLELFSGKIESRYDLCDAMIDGVLPKPIYKSAYTNLIGLESKLEERVQKLDATTHEYQEYMAILSDVKRRVHEAPSIPSILRKSIKPNGKYIYFCPPCVEEGTNDIETIKKQTYKWFREFADEEDIVFYTSTSDMGKIGERNRNAFYDDVTLDGEKAENKLRVMFAINQYNEGIHAPNIDGVIMGRGTTSDIVYFEQLGRALAVRGNTKEMFEKLEEYSVEELTQMCKSRDIPIKGNATKEDLIEKLIAPVVIDLTNNYDFIKELENNLRDRIKDIQSNGLGNHKNIKIRDASFDIEIENQDLFEMLRYVSDRLTMAWEDYYCLAKTYYEHYGYLLIPKNFKTINGYEYNEAGVKLSQWIRTQRYNYDKLSSERREMLGKICFVVSVLDSEWERNYNLAKVYYEHYGNLQIPQRFKTINGYEYDEDGTKLGQWTTTQRYNYDKLSLERREMLEKIGFAVSAHDSKWERNYNLAKVYYEHYGNLQVLYNFKTINGYEYDEDGVKLGQWIGTQRQKFDKLSSKRKEMLEKIGFVVSVNDSEWERNYNLAKVYYQHYGNLQIPQRFKTINGYEYDGDGTKLGQWIRTQRQTYDKLSPKRKGMLEKIDFVVSVHDSEWEKNYNLAKVYYERYGNLQIPHNFKTINGYECDDAGMKLGQWITIQRKITSPISERGRLLSSIGMIWNIKKNREEIMSICMQNNVDYNKNKTILSHISTQELQSKIEFLTEKGIVITDSNGLLHEVFSINSLDMKAKYGVSLEELIERYYIKDNKGKGV